MTVDDLIAQLALCRKRIKILRDDNQRLWESREQWKAKHASRQIEVQRLRRRVLRLDESRLMWRSRVPQPQKASWRNIHLSEQDLARILSIPVRRET